MLNIVKVSEKLIILFRENKNLTKVIVKSASGINSIKINEFDPLNHNRFRIIEDQFLFLN